MIANIEALFIIWRSRLGRLHDEMLFAGLKPIALDTGDIVSLTVPHARCGTVGVAAVGAAGDLDWDRNYLYGHHTGSVSI